MTAPLALAALALALPAVAAAHGIGAPPVVDPIAIALDWTFDPVPIAGIVGGAIVYALLLRSRPGAQRRPWPRLRTASFMGGLAFLALALLSPIDSLSDSLATVHMAQHMLLMLAAPPLLAAGAPMTLLLRAASPRVRARVLLPILHSRVMAALTHPVVAWSAFAGVLWATHYSGIYDAALLDPTVHALEHTAYLVAACLFWWPVFSPDPQRWRMSTPVKLVYVLLQMPQMSFLAVTIMGAPRLLYEAYLGRSLAYGVDPVADQQASGALMWVAGDMMFIAIMGLLVYRWMRESEEAAARTDAREDRLVEQRLAAVLDKRPEPR